MNTFRPHRRRFLLGSTSALLASALPALAQTPSGQGPIRVVVAFPPGGTADVLARALAEKMRPVLGADVIVDNKPGASGLIAAEHVVRSTPDGRTMLLASPLLIQAPFVLPRVTFDPLKDLEAVSVVARGSTVLVVPASLPVNSLSDFIAQARANPGKFSIGNYGQGSSSHIQAVALAQQAGMDVVQVSYRGATPLITDLLGGQITAAMSDIAAANPHVRTGKLKALAVSGSRPSALLPSAPTLASLGYRHVDMDGWMGMFVPVGVPAAVVARLHEAVSQAVGNADVSGRIEAIGMRPDVSTREVFARSVQRDAKSWEQVIRATNVRAE